MTEGLGMGFSLSVSGIVQGRSCWELTMQRDVRMMRPVGSLRAEKVESRLAEYATVRNRKVMYSCRETGVKGEAIF